MEVDEDDRLNVIVLDREECDRGVVDDWYNDEAKVDETTVVIVLGAVGTVTARNTDDDDDEDWRQYRCRS